MPKAKLFEYAVLHHEPAKRDVAGNETPIKTTLLKEPTTLLAGTMDEVSIVASRAIPDEYLDRLPDVEIVVRPF